MAASAIIALTSFLDCALNMKLYVTYGSPYARLARIIVIEKALEDRVEIIEAKTRTPGSPYYQINPSGRVPYLVDDTGVGMEDSQLICAYLDGLHGFIGFDPWQYLDDLAYDRHPNALEIVSYAIEQQGFVGVKLYPPMGFQPCDNAKRDPSSFPVGLQDLCYPHHPGVEIDNALKQVYSYCDNNKLAVMAHCADSMGAVPDSALNAEPRLWDSVLTKYRNLRLNLGHSGGIWDFYPSCAAGSMRIERNARGFVEHTNKFAE